VVREAVEERGRQLGIAEDVGPFAKGEVGGDDDRGTLVETASEVEQKLPSGLREGQVAEFIEDDLDLWAYINGVILDFSRPRKPTDNAFAEAFTARLGPNASTRTGSCRSRMPG
jgi:hypothetical protein